MRGLHSHGCAILDYCNYPTSIFPRHQNQGAAPGCGGEAASRRAFSRVAHWLEWAPQPLLDDNCPDHVVVDRAEILVGTRPVEPLQISDRLRRIGGRPAPLRIKIGHGGTCAITTIGVLALLAFRSFSSHSSWSLPSVPRLTGRSQSH